jgi:hypothetical protein
MPEAQRSRTEAAHASRHAPQSLGNEALMERLLEVQARAREIMGEFNIVSANVSVMAWNAEQGIADPVVRAEFLRLLIDLHEFGRTARQRGLLASTLLASTTSTGPQSMDAAATKYVATSVRQADPCTNLFASDDQAADSVSGDASRALFRFLDR